MTRTVNDARELAYAAHRGQVDKAGVPYFEHVAEVARRVEVHGDEAVMAGYLHDIVEDTDFTLFQLRSLGFPEAVVRAVDAVTRRDGEPYMDLIARAAADPLGRLVKLADNATNSDPERLALLDPATAERLRVKYARARQVLYDVAEMPEVEEVDLPCCTPMDEAHTLSNGHTVFCRVEMNKERL